jgi:hypothetical protein
MMKSREAQDSMKKEHKYVKMANVVILMLWSVVLAKPLKVSSVHPTDQSLCSAICLPGYSSSYLVLKICVFCFAAHIDGDMDAGGPRGGTVRGPFQICR